MDRIEFWVNDERIHTLRGDLARKDRARHIRETIDLNYTNHTIKVVVFDGARQGKMDKLGRVTWL